MRLIDGDALKEDLTRFYDGEVTARELIDEQPTIEAEPVKQDTELSIILQDYGIKDTDTLRYILDQYQKIIVDITGGQMSDMTYPAQAVIECTNDYYLSALADFKEKLVKHGQWIIDYADGRKIYHAHCSECGKEPNNHIGGDYYIDKLSDYCPNCGSKNEDGGSK